MTNLKTLFLFICFIMGLSVQAQTVKVGADGRKILEYPDGTWRYLTDDDPELKKLEIEKLPLENSSVDSKEKEKKKKKSTSAEKEEEFDARIKFVRELENLVRQAKKLDAVAKSYSAKRLELETELAVMRSSETPISFEDKEILERKVIDARDQEKVARKRADDLQSEVDFMEGLVYFSIKKRTKALAKYRTENNIASAPVSDEISRGTTEYSIQNTPTASTSRQVTQERSTNHNYASYSPSKDVILNPPKYKCNLIKDEVDEFTGSRIRTTSPELLFTYTRDNLRPYFVDREHTVCYANTTAMDGGIYVFSLDIAVASRTAKEEYGGLLRNGTLLVILLDGSTISMINNKTDRGTYDAARDVYTFKGNYQIPPKQVKDLIEGEIDKIRVVWEKGYDLYEIYEMDFLKNHLKCFE